MPFISQLKQKQYSLSPSCQHLDNNSVRLVNKATPSNQAIGTFSARHNIIPT